MSQAARAYYERRAEQISSPLPRLLDGSPLPILNADDPHEPEMLARNFADQMEDVEPFVLDGVRYLHGTELPQEEWNRVRGLRRYGGVLSVARYATRHLARHLLSDDPRSTIYLEALAEGEAPHSSYKNATINKRICRIPEHETARVILLARAVADNNEVIVAHLTIVWGEHKTLSPYIYRPKDQFLTPHYLGARVLDYEMHALPPLHRQ